MSNVLEKIVAARLEAHLHSNSLYDEVQSAYRTGHSTETALLRVHQDLTLALDRNCCAVLLMLDLSQRLTRSITPFFCDGLNTLMEYRTPLYCGLDHTWKGGLRELP